MDGGLLGDDAGAAPGRGGIGVCRATAAWDSVQLRAPACVREHPSGGDMKHFRSAAVAALVLGTLITSAGSALAAPPGNDTYGGRTVVGAIPFTDSLDTTEATTDSDDTDIRAGCFLPETDASVWYEFTATADGDLAVDVNPSTYSVGTILATGSPGNWTLLACAPGVLTWTATAGTTYTLLIFDSQLDGTGNGGTLNLTIDVLPPRPAIDIISVNPVGSFNSQTGSAVVSGTASCAGATFAFVQVDLTQRAGRFTVRGSGVSNLVCDGTAQPWTVEVVSDGNRFAGGKAASFTTAAACSLFECGFDSEPGTVLLRGKA